MAARSKEQVVREALSVVFEEMLRRIVREELQKALPGPIQAREHPWRRRQVAGPRKPGQKAAPKKSSAPRSGKTAARGGIVRAYLGKHRAPFTVTDLHQALTAAGHKMSHGTVERWVKRLIGERELEEAGFRKGTETGGRRAVIYRPTSLL